MAGLSKCDSRCWEGWPGTSRGRSMINQGFGMSRAPVSANHQGLNTSTCHNNFLLRARRILIGHGAGQPAIYSWEFSSIAYHTPPPGCKKNLPIPSDCQNYTYKSLTLRIFGYSPPHGELRPKSRIHPISLPPHTRFFQSLSQNPQLYLDQLECRGWREPQDRLYYLLEMLQNP